MTNVFTEHALRRVAEGIGIELHAQPPQLDQLAQSRPGVVPCQEHRHAGGVGVGAVAPHQRGEPAVPDGHVVGICGPARSVAVRACRRRPGVVAGQGGGVERRVVLPHRRLADRRGGERRSQRQHGHSVRKSERPATLHSAAAHMLKAHIDFCYRYNLSSRSSVMTLHGNEGGSMLVAYTNEGDFEPAR